MQRHGLVGFLSLENLGWRVGGGWGLGLEAPRNTVVFQTHHNRAFEAGRGYECTVALR